MLKENLALAVYKGLTLKIGNQHPDLLHPLQTMRPTEFGRAVPERYILLVSQKKVYVTLLGADLLGLGLH